MSTTTKADGGLKQTADVFSPRPSHSVPERRRRRRAKIAAAVRLQFLHADDAFDDMCRTVDVSRDGLLIATRYAGYSKGQALRVTFPYSESESALNQAKTAEVVRVAKDSHGGYVVAVQFDSAKNQLRRASSLPVSVDASGNDACGTSGLVPVDRALQSTVLVVGPDLRGAQNLRYVLESDGYAVVTVPSSNRALEVLRSTVPALFIADVELEERTGQDLCSIIKGNEWLRKVPVVFLTCSGRPADYVASRQLGAVVCMEKPFNMERLRDVVRLLAPPPGRSALYGAGRLSVDRAL